MRWYVSFPLAAGLALAVYALGAFTGKGIKDRLFPPPSYDALTTRPPNPSGLGRIQPKGEILSIGGIPGDRIKTLFYKVNERFKKGETLIEFFSRTERKQELILAEQQVVDAEKREREINAVEKAKLADLTAKGEKAKWAARLQKRIDDYQIPAAAAAHTAASFIEISLRSLTTVSTQDIQKATAEAASAKARYETALASQESAARQAELDEVSLKAAAEAVRRESELSRTALSIDVLKAQRTLAQLRLDRAQVTAESDGRVLRIFSREGGMVGNEPIMQVTTSEKMVVIAEVYVDAIKSLNKWLTSGQAVRATMRSQALDQELHGTVENQGAVAPSVARNALSGFSPRADADRRIIEVSIELDDESSKATAKFVGLEVAVEFHDPAKPK